MDLLEPGQKRPLKLASPMQRQSEQSSGLPKNQVNKNIVRIHLAQTALQRANPRAQASRTRSHESFSLPRASHITVVQTPGLASSLGLALILSLLLSCHPPTLCQTDESTTTSTTTTTTSSTTSTSNTVTANANITSQPVVDETTTDLSSGRLIDPQVSPSALLDQQPALQNNSTKLKPVNFTLVDELFEAVLSDDEVLRHWRLMDNQLQDGIKSLLKMIFPQIVSISQDAKVSGDCSGGILKWILSLRNLRSWAIKMLDATGKPTAGVFEGSLTMFGNYRQCLNIRAPDEDEIEISDQFEEYFRGQFCVIHLKPWMPAKKPFYHLNSTIEPLLRKNYKYYEKTLYDELAEIAIAFNFIDIRMDLCVPSTCSIADIQRVADLLSRKLEMRSKVMRCDIQARESVTFDYIELAWLVTPLTLITLVLFCSLWFLFRNSQSREGMINMLTIQGAFKQLTASKRGPQILDRPIPLYGLRNLFVFWFIVIQMTVELNYQYLRESMVLRNLILNYWPFQIIVNSSLLFESIILITAFSFGHFGLDATLKDLFKRLADKYVRLVLPIITLISIIIVTPRLAIESPLWRNFVERQSAVCKSTGLVNLFFLQNFISYDNILCLLAIPLVLMLRRNQIFCEDTLVISHSDELKKVTTRSTFTIAFCHLLKSKAGLASIFFVLVGLLVNFISVYYNQLPASWFYTFPDPAQKNFYFSTHLTKTWTHLSAFVIGLLAGSLCQSSLKLHRLTLSRCSHEATQPSPSVSNLTNQSRLNSYRSHESSSSISAIELGSQQTNDSSSVGRSSSSASRAAPAAEGKSTTTFIMLLASTTMIVIIFSTFSWSTGDRPSNLVAALYDSGSRFLWSLAMVILMIQLCMPDAKTNRFSSLATFLSHPFFISIGRLSLLAYLLSPYVNTFVLAVEEQSLFPSLFMIFHLIVGNIVITYLLAIIIAILVEQPSRNLVKRFVSAKKFQRHTVNISHCYMDHCNKVATPSDRVGET